MKRTWKNCEINVYIYIFTYDKGVIFLYVNYTDYVYEENIQLTLGRFLILDNLRLQPHYQDNIVRFIIHPYE